MVCLGNICRSPLAEGILKDKVTKKGLNVMVDSAGTSNVHQGENPDSRSIQNAKSHGIDISNLKARQFKTADFDHFDKIFVMDASNFNDVISLARDEKDKAKVNLILNSTFPKENRSVPDPYFGGQDGFETVFQLLDKATDAIVNSLDRTN